MNALFAPESKSFSRSYLEILRFSPDITRRTTLSDSPAEYPNGQNRDDGLQIGFLEKRFGLRTGLHFRGIGTKGSPLEIGIPHRDLRLVGTARRRPRPCHRLLTGDRCRLPGGTGIRTLTIGGGNRQSDEPFELSGAHARAPGVFPQPSKTAVWTQFLDIKWINPTGRLSDSVR